MKLNVEDLLINSHNFEEENFENFDDIYDGVMNGEMDVEKEDIVKVCNIFMTPFREIHPHQYTKLIKITYYIIDQVGYRQGFRELISGVLMISDDFLKEYLKMLIYSYSELELEYFRKLLLQIEIQDKERILNVVNSIAFIGDANNKKDVLLN